MRALRVLVFLCCLAAAATGVIVAGGAFFLASAAGYSDALASAQPLVEGGIALLAGGAAGMWWAA